MLNGNHTCNSSYGIVAPCREYFEADPKTGEMRQSFAGADYDCRGRGWYSNAADSRTSRWSSLYIDKTSKQAAFAYCTPLQNFFLSFFLSFCGTKKNSVGILRGGLEMVVWTQWKKNFKPTFMSSSFTITTMGMYNIPIFIEWYCNITIGVGCW